MSVASLAMGRFACVDEVEFMYKPQQRPKECKAFAGGASWQSQLWCTRDLRTYCRRSCKYAAFTATDAGATALVVARRRPAVSREEAAHATALVVVRRRPAVSCEAAGATAMVVLYTMHSRPADLLPNAAASTLHSLPPKQAPLRWLMPAVDLL